MELWNHICDEVFTPSLWYALGTVALLWAVWDVWCRRFDEPKRKWLRVFQDSFSGWFFLLIGFIVIVAFALPIRYNVLGLESSNPLNPMTDKILAAVLITLIGTALIVYCNRLKNAMKLKLEHYNDTFNFWIQTSIVLIVVAYLVLTICLFQITKDNFLPFSICAFILGIIFKEIAAGIMAFYHMWSTRLLRVGDWIQIPSKGVDGQVVDVSLVSVKIENWDTTTSSIPTYVLMQEHLRNNQKMVRGETFGRQMAKRFLIDTKSLRTLKPEEFKAISKRLKDMGGITMIWETNAEDKLNIHYFREYFYHWLCRHDNISQKPNLLVRIQEHTPEGLPIQIYGYINKTGMVDFEREQSKIIEHFLSTLEVFGLKLFQYPSATPSPSK